MKIILNKKAVSSFFAVLLIALMVASMFALQPSLVSTANAQSTQTTTIQSNLLQYEWPQIGGDDAHSFTSAGPGPSSFNIQWRTQIPLVSYTPVAFDGKIFISTTGFRAPTSQDGTYCLDAATGQILWKDIGVTGNIQKLDENYMLIGNNAYKTSDGSLAWKGPAGVYFSESSWNGGAGYNPDLKVIFAGSTAWSLPDASQPPTLLWNRANQTDFGKYGTETLMGYSNGVLVYGTSYEYLLGVNANTGKTIWATPTVNNQWLYGLSIEEGVIGFGSLNGNFYAWNLTTGEHMWTYNPGTFMDQFASASGAAYGMFYEHNEDTYTYALNATTGALVWRAKGPGVAYSNTLSIAGGKVYIQSGSNNYVDFTTGEPGHSEFDCYNAYTGALVWSAPFEDSSPFAYQCNAYGNLYVVPCITSSKQGTFTYAFTNPDAPQTGATNGMMGEVWCISDTPQNWSMLMNNAEHNSYGDGPTSLSLAWKFTAGGGIASSPTLVNGVAYLTSYDGKIYAINANTGQQIWTYSVGKIGLSSSVAVVNGKLYTGADDGNVYCLNANTGTKLWEASAGGSTSGTSAYIFVPTGSPTVANGKVYVAGGDNNLYCYDANTGAVVWKFDTGGSLSTTPVVVDDAVFMPTSLAPGAVLFKLNATTGQQIFNATLNGFLGTVGVSASATYGAGMVFVRTNFRYNYAVNATTGQIVWMVDSYYNTGGNIQQTATQQLSSMIYVYGRVYFQNYYGVSCVNAYNGTQIWYTWLNRENLAQGLSYSYGRIYTVNEDGVLYVLDALTGAKLSYYSFTGGGTSLHSMPVPYNGSLYLGSLDWNLYCFVNDSAVSPTTPSPDPIAASSLNSTSTPMPQPTMASGATASPSSGSSVAPTTQSDPSAIPSTSPAAMQSNLNTEIYLIGVVAVIIIVVAVAAAFILRRRRTK